MIGTGMPHFVSNNIGFVLHVYQYDVETYRLFQYVWEYDYSSYEQIL